LTSDGLTVDGDGIINGELELIDSGTYQLHLASNTGPYSNAGIFLGSDTSDPYYYGTIKWDQSDVSLHISSQHGNNTGGIVFETGSGTSAQSERMQISNNGDISFYEDTGTTPKFFWDASAESLGIGTSSPTYKLHVDADTNSVFRLGTTGGGALNVLVDDYTLAAPTWRIQSGGSEPISFAISATEAMRIDASGNVIMGKTTADNTTEGFTFYGAADGVSIVKANGQPLILNRLTNDGDIVQFRKDGSTVGSIGNVGNNVYYSGGSQLNFSTGLLMKGASVSNTRLIAPSDDSGTELDDKVSLGRDVSRFKDLYLSGGVYLGGTGAANKLDDYETGTWTPTISSGTFTAQEAVYTKVGNLVTLCCRVDTFSDVTSSNPVTIGGIPFSRKTGTSGMGSSIAQNVSDVNKQTVYMQAANIVFYGWNSGGYSKLPHSGLNSGAQIYLSVTYTTD
jgi:hypothetical protein